MCSILIQREYMGKRAGRFEWDQQCVVFLGSVPSLKPAFRRLNQSPVKSLTGMEGLNGSVPKVRSAHS